MDVGKCQLTDTSELQLQLLLLLLLVLILLFLLLLLLLLLLHDSPISALTSSIFLPQFSQPNAHLFHLHTLAFLSHL
jgi:hypothetical protein